MESNSTRVVKRSKEEVVSHWRPFVHVMENDAFNPLTVPKYKIWVREDGYHLISRGGRKEVRVDKETLDMCPKICEFLTSFREPISWLNLETWILNNKVLCVEVWLDIVPFRIMTNDKGVYMNHLHTFARSLSRLSQTTTLIYGDYALSSAPSPWVFVPFTVQSTLEKRIEYVLSSDNPPLTISGIPGFRLPYETSRDAIHFFNIFTHSLVPSIETSLFTWEIQGCLQFSPHLCETQTKLKKILDDLVENPRSTGDSSENRRSTKRKRNISSEDEDESKIEKMGPILVVSHCPFIYDGEGTVIINTWKDFSTFSLSKLLGVKRVILDMALYRSSRYSTYLEACVSVLLEFPEELHSTYSRFVDMEEYCRHKAAKTNGGMNHFDISNARSLWHSSPHMQKVSCMPFEFGTWSLVFWEDIHALPITHFSFMKAMAAKLQVGFTHTRGFSIKDREFMHHACVRCLSPHLLPYPNLRDIVDGCFLCSKVCWSWELPIRTKRVMIDLSKHEDYTLQSHDIAKITDATVSPLLVTASQDYISNQRPRLQISSQHELNEWLRNHFNGEIMRIKDRLANFKEKYKSELQTLVRMESIPPSHIPPSLPHPRIPTPTLPPPPLRAPPPSLLRSRRIPPPPPRRVPPIPSPRPVISSASVDTITSAVEPRMENPQPILSLVQHDETLPPQDPSHVPPPPPDAQQHLQFLTESMSLQLTSLRNQKEKLEHTLEELTLQKSRSLGKLEGVITEWKEGTQCSLCFTNPISVITPCLHSFCLLCVIRLFSSKGSRLSERNMRLAKCPHCKANLEINKATFVTTSTDPRDLSSRFTVLDKVLDSKTIHLLCEVMKVIQEESSPSRHLIICSSSFEEKNLMIGIRYLKNHSEASWNPEKDIQIAQRSDISFVYQQEPVTHIWTTFHVSESFEEIPFFRYFCPIRESYPTVTSFEWRV